MAKEKWKLDTVHSSVSFSLRHIMISRVHGVFKSWSGTLETADAHPENTKLEATLTIRGVTSCPNVLALARGTWSPARA
jgi:polyisoprenoid-binding protein YceI